MVEKGLKVFRGSVSGKEGQWGNVTGGWREDDVCYVGAICLTKPSLAVTWKMKDIIYKFMNLTLELSQQHTELFIWLSMM